MHVRDRCERWKSGRIAAGARGSAHIVTRLPKLSDDERMAGAPSGGPQNMPRPQAENEAETDRPLKLRRRDSAIAFDQADNRLRQGAAQRILAETCTLTRNGICIEENIRRAVLQGTGQFLEFPGCREIIDGL